MKSAEYTHLKSPSNFSCCTSFETMGLIRILLTIVPMIKYPKMHTGPNQPVLKWGKRREVAFTECYKRVLLFSVPSHTITLLHIQKPLFIIPLSQIDPLKSLILF